MGSEVGEVGFDGWVHAVASFFPNGSNLGGWKLVVHSLSWPAVEIVGLADSGSVAMVVVMVLE